jgi:hypothetical protein
MIIAQDQEVQSLVTEIYVGRLLLPEMQCSYAWKGVQVLDMFDLKYCE